MTRKVIAVVDDLFFASKIRGAGEQFGVVVTFARSVAALLEAARRDLPALIICDLHSERVSALEVAKELKSDETLRAIPLVGFFSHVQTELQHEAEAAGFDQVLPRSVFTRNLGPLLAGAGPD
jgi:CheY-like chemotaxis protein